MRSSFIQCSNCEREFAGTDLQFCPYCASPLNLPIKEKKKKNDDKASNFKFDWRATLFTLLLPVGALLSISFLIEVSKSMIDAILLTPFVVIVAAGIMINNRCERCGYFFTMNKIGSEQISSEKIYRTLENPSRQVVFLRVTWKDTYRCSCCQCEKAYTRHEDFDSFTE